MGVSVITVIQFLYYRRLQNKLTLSLHGIEKTAQQILAVLSFLTILFINPFVIYFLSNQTNLKLFANTFNHSTKEIIFKVVKSSQ